MRYYEWLAVDYRKGLSCRVGDSISIRIFDGNQSRRICIH